MRLRGGISGCGIYLGVCLWLAAGVSPALAVTGSEDIVTPIKFEKLIDQVRDNMITMRWLDKVKERVEATHKNADEIYEALNEMGRAEEAEKFNQLKRKLVMLRRQMPQRGPGFLTTIQDMLTYRNQRLPKAVQDMKEAIKTVGEYEANLKTELEAWRKRQTEQAKAEQTPAPTTGANRAWDAAGVEIYVAEVSGDMRFFVNDQRVETGDTLPLTPGNRIEVRAMVMGEQRKRALDFKPTPNVTSYDSDPYFLNYKVSLPAGGMGETSWEVMEESYTWSVQPSKVGAEWTIQDGGQAGVKNDAVVLSAPGTMKFTLQAQGKARWETTYKTHGNPMSATDEGSGRIVVAIAPK